MNSAIATGSSAPHAAPGWIARGRTSPAWMARVLAIAGVYNILWGAIVILLPQQTLALLDLPDQSPVTLNFWACIGMIVGVYGVGYLAAARDPLRHWPIVLVGFLGKIFGPIGLIKPWNDGTLPSEFWLTIIFNDLIWWVPFALILLAALRTRGGRA
jgi:small multidrug resistance pump